MYRYFKGENANPFDRETENPQFMFWGYEQTFEDKFSGGDYDDLGDADNNAELKAALNPPNKTEVFKIWLFDLLVCLADKYETPFNELEEWYWGNN